ncbi:YfdX family protein [Persephonella sp. KM09-Lau-8]|uniref:YfdX family protein n=1 Tax=Persephonella sp. KM09-Lau-8 TaxID=1158345 RepID=UPI000498240E|nr:YfdX family protein [Persephonella sp. KM09-Lau-8]
MRKLLGAVLSAAIIVSPVFAKEENKKTNIQQKQETASSLIESSGKRSTQKVREQELQKIIKEAASIYAEGNRILFLLTHNKIEEAKKALKALKERVDKLEKQYQGKMVRLPIDVIVNEVVGITDIEQAKKLAEEVKKAVKNNDFIKARILLNALRSEIVIETVYLPIGLYKQAIDLAYKFLEEGKVKNAISQLQVAMNTIEIDTTIIPEPIAIASLLVEDASKRFKDNPEQALKLLEEAKRQIKLAKVLGYIRNDKDIEPLIKQIEKLEKEVKAKTGTKEKFKSLFESIEKFKESSTQTSTK